MEQELALEPRLARQRFKRSVPTKTIFYVVVKNTVRSTPFPFRVQWDFVNQMFVAQLLVIGSSKKYVTLVVSDDFFADFLKLIWQTLRIKKITGIVPNSTHQAQRKMNF